MHQGGEIHSQCEAWPHLQQAEARLTVRDACE
jgi:hypothetical protein